MHVENWNRVQNVADFFFFLGGGGGGSGGYYINMKSTHVCNIKFDTVRIFTNVRYWHQIRDVLVPIVLLL